MKGNRKRLMVSSWRAVFLFDCKWRCSLFLGRRKSQVKRRKSCRLSLRLTSQSSGFEDKAQSGPPAKTTIRSLTCGGPIAQRFLSGLLFDNSGSLETKRDFDVKHTVVQLGPMPECSRHQGKLVISFIFEKSIRSTKCPAQFHLLRGYRLQL